MLKVVEIFFLKLPKHLCLREGWREESDEGRDGGREGRDEGKGGRERRKRFYHHILSVRSLSRCVVSWLPF